MESSEENKKENNEEVKKVVKEKKIKLDFGFRKTIILIIILLVLCITVIFLLRATSVFFHKEKVLKLGLEDVGELVTQSCHVVVLEDSKVDRKFFDKYFTIPFTESRQIFSYDFDVDASIDFGKIEPIPDDENKKVVVKLPHAKIFKPSIVLDSLEVYLDEESLFSRISLEKNNEAKLAMQEKAVKQCTDSNLLESADANAQKLIKKFIQSDNNYKNYEIVFEYIGE